MIGWPGLVAHTRGRRRLRRIRGRSPLRAARSTNQTPSPDTVDKLGCHGESQAGLTHPTGAREGDQAVRLNEFAHLDNLLLTTFTKLESCTGRLLSSSGLSSERSGGNCSWRSSAIQLEDHLGSSQVLETVRPEIAAMTHPMEASPGRAPSSRTR